MAKLPNPFAKPTKVPTPQPKKATKEEGDAQMEAGQLLYKFGQKGPLAPKKAPAHKPEGGYKTGMSGQHYDGGAGIDPTKLRPKLATKDKILNPVRSAVGLSHLNKSPKMVPKKPGK